MEINKLKTVELKKELQKQGLPTYGRKSLLIKRLQETRSASINSEDENESAIHVNKQNGPKKKRKPINGLKLLNNINALKQQIKHLKVIITKLSKKFNCNKKPLNETCKEGPRTNQKSKNIDIQKSYLNNKKQEKLLHKPIAQKKSQILILSDNNGHDCVDILTSNCGNEYIVSSFFKPNAAFEEVTSSATAMCTNFTKSDHVIIFAGIANVLRGKPLNILKLTNLLMGLKNTNVSIVSCTYCRNRNFLNKFIYEFNVNLVKAERKFDHVRYIETNRVLNREGIYNYKPYLNYTTKNIILKSIYTDHIRNKFINYENLKEVMTLHFEDKAQYNVPQLKNKTHNDSDEDILNSKEFDELLNTQTDNENKQNKHKHNEETVDIDDCEDRQKIITCCDSDSLSDCGIIETDEEEGNVRSSLKDNVNGKNFRKATAKLVSNIK